MSVRLDEARIRLLNINGGIQPTVNNTYNLGTSSLKWANVYATKFIGALNGNADTATALTTSDGSSSQPIYFSNGKPVAVTLKSTCNNLLNALDVGSSTPVDADYYISQYVSGGTTTTTYHRRPMSALYSYIKGKAEGTWNINISGNASTASSIAWGNITNKPGSRFVTYYNTNSEISSTESVNTESYIHTVGASGNSIATTTKPSGMDNAWGIIHLHLHSGDYAMQLGFGGTTGNLYQRHAYASTTFGAWKTILDSNNYTSYTVTKTGSGASGTWGINISGNATTASKLTPIETNDTASSSATWRRLWMCWTDNTTGRPAYDDRFAVQTSTGTLKAPIFSGSLTGNATTATKLTSSAGSSTQPIYFSDGKPVAITGTISNNSASADRILYKSNHTEAASGTTGSSPTEGLLYTSGLFLTGTYNDSSTPVSYGNIINIAGYGTGQLLCQWQGSDNVAGHLYYRSHRDTSTGGWSPWITILDSSNYNSYSPTLTGTGASGTWGISVTGSAATLYNSSANSLIWGGDHMLSSTNRPAAKLHFGTDTLYQYRGSSYHILIDAGNYTSYTVTKTGGGAGGTWGINITGSADRATYITDNTNAFYSGNSSSTILIAKTNNITTWALERNGTNEQLAAHFYNSAGAWTSGNILLDSNNYTNYCATKDHTHTTLPSHYLGDTSGPYIYTDANHNFMVRAGSSTGYAWLNMNSDGHLYVGGYQVLTTAGGYLNGQLISRSVNGGTWINGTHSASFVVDAATTASASSYYQAWYSGKTQQGAWSLGALSGDESLYFVYGTDNDYNAGTNSTASTHIDSDGKVYGAVWNDYAEYRSQTEELKPGHVAYCDNDGKLKQTTSRLQKFEGVVSDTFGFAIGETEEAKTPLAVSGRVLVYTYEDRNTFNSGDCVCAGPNGRVCKMTREEIAYYPDRIVGIVSEIPEYDTWGTGNVDVDGRIWIKIR